MEKQIEVIYVRTAEDSSSTQVSHIEVVPDLSQITPNGFEAGKPNVSEFMNWMFGLFIGALSSVIIIAALIINAQGQAITNGLLSCSFAVLAAGAIGLSSQKKSGLLSALALVFYCGTIYSSLYAFGPMRNPYEDAIIDSYYMKQCDHVKYAFLLAPIVSYLLARFHNDFCQAVRTPQ